MPHGNEGADDVAGRSMQRPYDGELVDVGGSVFGVEVRCGS